MAEVRKETETGRRRGDQGHHGAGNEIHVPSEIEKEEVPDIRQAADERSEQDGRALLSPDQDGTNECNEADPAEVEAVLVEDRPDRIRIVNGEVGGVRRVRDPLDRGLGVARNRQDARQKMHATPNAPQHSGDP